MRFVVVLKLKEKNSAVTYLGVDEFGQVNPDEFRKAVNKNTCMVSIMHSNNEVGTINPIQELVRITREVAPNALFHTDCSQSAAKVQLDVKKLAVDFATLAGHKIYAPKGVGALYQRAGLEIKKFLYGAGQEMGYRAGTENVILNVGFGKACEIANKKLPKMSEELLRKREFLYNLIKTDLETAEGEFRVNGHPKERLPNTLSISFKGILASALLHEIKDELACSAGAACHSNEVKISRVLRAMKVPEEFAKGTVRLSVGSYTTEKQMKKGAKALCSQVKKMWAKMNKDIR